MGILFVCPNCGKLVDPMSANATMAAATKVWQHKDCQLEPARKSGAGAGAGAGVGPPAVERRRWPRR